LFSKMEPMFTKMFTRRRRSHPSSEEVTIRSLFKGSDTRKKHPNTTITKLYSSNNS